MATNSDGKKPSPKDSADGKKPSRAENKPLIPPDEDFWQRYSPHHEFPLSLSSSGVVHITVFGLMVLGGILGARWYSGSNVDVDTIEIAGGGGQIGGFGDKTTGPNLQPQEAAKNVAENAPKQELAPQESLKQVDSTPQPLIKPDQPLVRPIEESIGLGKNLDEVGKKAMEKLALLQQGGTISKGRGGSGEGGGLGKGRGTGIGDLEGAGRMKITKRQQRQLRWVMKFNIRMPEDYARQLQGLKAILAIPIAGKEKEFEVIENLSQRPVKPKVKDVTEINRIYWVDDRRESVASLARVLGVDPVPPYFVAFFPAELEQKLLEKELAAARGKPEEKIRETQFEVQLTKKGYEPFVVKQDVE
jgi:hypothetical protein